MSFEEWSADLDNLELIGPGLHPAAYLEPQALAATNKPVVVSGVTLLGLEKTKHDYVEAYLQPLYEAKTFDEALTRLSGISHTLEQLGLFKHVDVFLHQVEPEQRLDESGELAADFSTDDSLPVPLTADLRFEESKFRKVRVSANGGASTSSLGGTASASLLNLLGRGESLTLKADLDQASNKSYLLTLRKPLVTGRKQADFAEASMEFFHDRADYADHRPYSETRNGMSLRYLFRKHHQVSYEHAFRDNELNDPTRQDLSVSLRANTGKSVKSAVKYAFKLDTQNHPALPTSGYLLRSETELAGLLGDVSHLRQTLSAQIHLPVPRVFNGHSSLGLLFRAGLLLPFHRTASRVNDRFMLGGPALFRGFDTDGVGPRDRADSLGSEFYSTATLDYRFPLPKGLPEWLQGHAFLAVGTTLNTIRDRSDSLSALLSNNFRRSAGLGVVAELFGNHRFELNICFGHQHLPSDRPVRWEFGFWDMLQ